MLPPRPYPWHLLMATSLLVVVDGGCSWNREAAVSPKTIVSRQLCRQGIAAMERNQWDEAEPLLAKAVDVCPEAPEARAKYADLLWHRNQHAEAIREMAEAVRLAPDDAASRVTYGEMQLAMGDIESAGEAADLALDMNPKLASAWALRGRLMRRTGKQREALSDLHRAEGLDPKDSSYPMEIAELYLGLHEPDRALATLQSLSSRWSDQEEPAALLSLKGMAYSTMGRYDDAANTFLLACSRGGADIETLYRLAETQVRAGRPREAAAALKKALSLDPQHAASRHLLAQLGTDRGSLR
ncbi:MAG: tetratricopeptide repeat protein [Planctomycetaceae bacterium]|nr:tetratricopeptide repeat protein [Planctomycetaceae bacterium]